MVAGSVYVVAAALFATLTGFRLGIASASTVVAVGVAGVVSGVVFVGVTPYFGGSGGKLGTIAFTACLLTWAVTVATPHSFGDDVNRLM